MASAFPFARATHSAAARTRVQDPDHVPDRVARKAVTGRGLDLSTRCEPRQAQGSCRRMPSRAAGSVAPEHRFGTPSAPLTLRSQATESALTHAGWAVFTRQTNSPG